MQAGGEMGQIMSGHQQLSERQKQIIESAIKLIAEEGIGNFTIRRLAQAVNVSEPAIYRHFENKDAIILGLFRYINEGMLEIFNSFDNVAGKSSIEILEIKNMLLMQFFYKNICWAKTSASSGMFFPNKNILNESRKLSRDAFDNVKALVEKGQKEGDIKAGLDSEHLTKIILGVQAHTIHSWVMSEKKYDLVAEWMRSWEVIKQLIAVE